MTKHYQKAQERAAWIWQRYKQKGHITSVEIRKQFGRQGRELEKEIRQHGIKLPPIMTDKEVLALSQSQTLMRISSGKAMTTREMAAALGVNYYSVKAIRKKLIERELPCPALKRDRKQPDIDHVKLPDNMREQVSTRYPSYLQAMSCRPIEINGEKLVAYLLW